MVTIEPAILNKQFFTERLMIITITGADGPQSSIRLIVQEDCSLSPYQYQRLRNLLKGDANEYHDLEWIDYQVDGIDLQTWDQILFITDAENYGEGWALLLHEKRQLKRISRN